MHLHKQIAALNQQPKGKMWLESNLKLKQMNQPLNLLQILRRVS